VVLAFSIARYSQASEAGQYLGGIALAIGLALVPRMVWTIEHLWEATPADRPLSWHIGGALAIGFTAAAFVAFQYSVAIDALNLGVQFNPATLGNVLSPWQELLAGTAAVGDARFYTLTTTYTARAGIMALALFLLQDALNDFFGFSSKGIVPKLNS
jgi:hypothetical protein